MHSPPQQDAESGLFPDGIALMVELSQFSVRNRLLAALSPESFATIEPHLELVDLPLRTVLVVPDVDTEHVVFIEAGLGSVVAISSDDERVKPVISAGKV